MKKWLADVDRYWFGPVRGESIGLIRIIIGTLAFFALVLLGFDFYNFFGNKGLMSPALVRDQLNLLPVTPGNGESLFTNFPFQIDLPFRLPRLSVIPPGAPDSWTLTVYIVTLISAAFFTVGRFTKVFGLTLAVGLLSLHLRNIYIIHSGDTLMRLTIIYLALGNAGAAYSLDRFFGVRSGKLSPEPQLVSAWPQRLIAFQIALCYFTTVWHKWYGSTWQNGTATYFPTGLHEFDRFPVPAFLERQPFIGLTTYGTLLVELALATVVFYKPWRKWVLISGVMLHGYIEYRFNIPFFAMTIVTGYIAFYEGDEVAAWVKKKMARFFPKWAPKTITEEPAVALAAES